MKVLVVIHGAARSDFWEKVLKETTRPEKVIKLARGIVISSADLHPAVCSDAPFDLILYHCGATNTEHSLFIPKYEELCRQREYPHAAIILFSGAPDAITRARSRFASNAQVCVVAEKNLIDNLGKFLEGWNSVDAGVTEGRKGDCLPCDLLDGFSEVEVAYQTLSALLPFGLLWEAQGTLDDRSGLELAVRDLDIKNFSDFERHIAELVLDYLGGGSGVAGWHAQGYQWRLQIIDRALSAVTSCPELIAAWDLCADEEAPRNLDGALKTLVASKTLIQWNTRLSALRDILLMMPS